MSIHIKVNSSDRMPLLDMWRLIFKFTFDKKNCPYNTKITLETELLKWNGYVKMEKVRIMNKYGLDNEFIPVGQKGSIIDEIEYQVGYMCSWCVREEQGEFKALVDTYKRSNIDYRLAEPMRKVFPECKQLRNYARGRAAMIQAMKDNPQDYKPFNKEN